jgi:hypothetical protein
VNLSGILRYPLHQLIMQFNHTVVVGLGTTALGAATPRTYIKRKSDNRAADDTTYRFRYVIPASSGGSVGRPPTDGYIFRNLILL